MKEAFGEEPITGGLFHGPRPDTLHEEADSYETSRRDHDYEGGPNGKSELAMDLHNDEGFQSFIRRLAAHDQRYQDKKEDVAVDGWIEFDLETGRNEELHRVRSEIADEIEKEMYRKLASIGEEEGQVDQDDFLRVQAELVTEYHTDVNRLDIPDYVSDLPLTLYDEDDSRPISGWVPVKSDH